MDDWVYRQGCREIFGVKLQATRIRRHSPQPAVLDRAFIYPAAELSSSLTTTWNRTGFDHALITVRLPHVTDGWDRVRWGVSPQISRPQSPSLQN